MTIEVEVGNIVQVVDDRNLIVIDQGNTVEVAAMGAQGPTGPTGATGATGPQGPSGVISVTAPITNSGSSTSAVIGVNVGTTSATVAAGDRGLPAGGTTGQVLRKTSNADYADEWADVRVKGTSGRAVMANSVYVSDNGLEMFGVASPQQYAQSPDSAALSQTGDMEIVVKFTSRWASGARWQPALLKGLLTINRDYEWYIMRGDGGGGMFFSRIDNAGAGVSYATASNANFVANTTYWVKVEFDIDNGASQSQATFYTSTDGVTFTQLGTPVTNANRNPTRDSANALNIGHGLSADYFDGTIHRVTIRNGIGGTVVYDANFEAATPETLFFNESSSNAALVSIVTPRYSFSVPNINWAGANSSVALTANNVYYQVFVVTEPVVVDYMRFHVWVAPSGGNANLRMGIYAADSEFQPTGGPVVQTSTATVPSGTTGTYTLEVTPTTLQPGMYVTAVNTDRNITLMAVQGGFLGTDPSAGTSACIIHVRAPQTFGIFPNPGTKWTVRAFGQGAPLHTVFMRWRPE